MKEYFVSIVIPVYNAGRTIAKTIDACLNQDYPQENLEIIVVNDGSTDNTAEIIEKYPVKYIFQEKSGPAKARNTGWKNARGEIICFTDADCIPPKDWIFQISKYYISDDVAGVGGSYEILNPTSLLASCIHEEIVSRHLKMAKKGVTHLGSFNLSLRKSVLERIGGFNEGLKMSEDRDISYRIAKLGWRLILDPDIKVYHLYPTNLIKYLKQQFFRVYWLSMHCTHDAMKLVKDKYVLPAEYFQPPLFLGIVFLSLVALFFPHWWKLVLAFILLALLLQLPLVFSIIKRTKKIKYLILTGINFLRGFAWALGGVTGIIAVMLRKRT